MIAGILPRITINLLHSPELALGLIITHASPQKRLTIPFSTFRPE